MHLYRTKRNCLKGAPVFILRWCSTCQPRIALPYLNLKVTIALTLTTQRRMLHETQATVREVQVHLALNGVLLLFSPNRLHVIAALCNEVCFKRRWILIKPSNSSGWQDTTLPNKQSAESMRLLFTRPGLIAAGRWLPKITKDTQKSTFPLV